MERSKSTILHMGETMCIEFFPSQHLTKKIAFVFTGSSNRYLDLNRDGGDLLVNSGFDVINFKIINDDWFQSIPKNIFEIINRISYDYEYKVGYGTSMGGYGVIAFSKLLNLDVALTFSPQFSIDEPFDTRWKSKAEEIVWNYRISKDSINQATKFTCVYDGKSLDAKHIERIYQLLPIGNLTKISFPYTGHATIAFLHEINHLKKIVLDVLENKLDVDISSTRRLKSTSTIYLGNFSGSLRDAKKFKFALDVVNKALALKPNSAQYLKDKSYIEWLMGRHDEAIATANKAIKLDEKNPHQYSNLSQILIGINDFTGALTAINTAINLDGNNSQFLSQKNYILLNSL